MNTIIEQQIMETAKRRIGFKIHFSLFLILFPVNWIIWYATNTTYLWPIWPTLGWSLGIVVHWLGTYHSDKFLSLKKQYERELNLKLEKAKKERGYLE